jgi:hypothetical protein
VPVVAGIPVTARRARVAQERGGVVADEDRREAVESIFDEMREDVRRDDEITAEDIDKPPVEDLISATGSARVHRWLQRRQARRERLAQRDD